ncbi:hypothetical protein RJT34_18857 [Clitoria ternatea]|uniref:Uncharacterized protein n=1 Tax=Clitoria ternatea TaxID=43366 RepID=A0AAN9P2J7_CLITE
MSCISLRLRLPPARKAWKSFTSTLGKLHKIRRSKAMKKHRKKHSKTRTKQATKIPPKFFTTKRFGRKRLATVRSFIYGFQKKPAPVYIDKLFKEPSCELVEQWKPQTVRKPRIEKICSAAGEVEAAAGSSSTSDDMWESVALASPLMQGIDQRAEEFITRFREQMAAQETLARNL